MDKGIEFAKKAVEADMAQDWPAALTNYTAALEYFKVSSHPTSTQCTAAPCSWAQRVP